jgi:cytochrome P450
MRPTPVPLDQVDLADLSTFERNEAWGMFETLRAEAPCHWTEEHDGGSGFWAITRYDDIEKVDKDPETFTSMKFTNLEEPPAEFQERRRSILETDGPRHQSLRKLLMRDFSAAQLRRYEDFLRGLAALTVETALQQEEMDFVDAIAADYPIAVLARLLDTPEDMTPQLISWGNEIVGFSDPEYASVLVNSEESK